MTLEPPSDRRTREQALKDLATASLAGLPTHPPEPCPWCRHCDRFSEALRELVRLKDGPRDDAYRAAKDAAWDAARVALNEGPV